MSVVNTSLLLLVQIEGLDQPFYNLWTEKSSNGLRLELGFNNMCFSAEELEAVSEYGEYLRNVPLVWLWQTDILHRSEIPHMNRSGTGKSGGDIKGDTNKGDHLLLGSVSWCRPSCPVMKEQLAAHKALRGAEPGEPLPGKEPCVHYSSSHPLHHLS